MSLRNERVRKTLMKEIADIIQKELRDSRINGVVSITDVEMSHDNSFAKVYYSVLAGEQDKANTIKAITENTSKVRYEAQDQPHPAARRVPTAAGQQRPVRLSARRG